MIRVWPSGWVCQAVRAPGSNVTLAPAARAGALAENSGSMRTVPVNQSAGPLPDGCEPTRLISMADSDWVPGDVPVGEWIVGEMPSAAAPASCKNVRRDNSAGSIPPIDVLLIGGLPVPSATAGD